MPAGIRVRGVENPQGFGMINADRIRYNTDATDDTDARRSVKIRPIGVIRVPCRDGGAGSYAVAGIAKLCDLCVLCGDLIRLFL
ncbi:MAG: hypothetical protein WC556_07930 [Candidatus Methanoperedens sp.]